MRVESARRTRSVRIVQRRSRRNEELLASWARRGVMKLSARRRRRNRLMVVMSVMPLDTALTEQFFEVVEHATQRFPHQVDPAAKLIEVRLSTAGVHANSNAAVSEGLWFTLRGPGSQLGHCLLDMNEALVDLVQAFFHLPQHSRISFPADRSLQIVRLLGDSTKVFSKAFCHGSRMEVVSDIPVRPNCCPLKRPGMVVEFCQLARLGGIRSDEHRHRDDTKPEKCSHLDISHFSSPSDQRGPTILCSPDCLVWLFFR